MKVSYNIISAIVLLLLTACAGPLDNADFIPGPDGEVGNSPETEEIVPDVVGFDQVKVISFNVRTSTADKGTANAWDKRKAAAPALIRKENPTLFGVQEAMIGQVDYMKDELPEYEWIGVGRDDGEKKGEMMAVFYKKSDLQLEDWDTFWLADGGPATPTLGWDATYMRTATWAIFTHVPTGRKFFYINTHLDHQAQKAREESIKLICSRLTSLNPTGLPAVITADFNSETSDAIFNPLKAMMNNTREYSASYDNFATFNGWGSNSSRKIDHIFISPGFKSLSYRTIRERYANVSYVSDHYPISSLLEFNQ